MHPDLAKQKLKALHKRGEINCNCPSCAIKRSAGAEIKMMRLPSKKDEVLATVYVGLELVIVAMEHSSPTERSRIIKYSQGLLEEQDKRIATTEASRQR